MPIIKAILKDGRELNAYCVVVSTSDRGPILFTPSDRATRNFIAKAHDDAKKLFGNEPVILVPPRITRDDEDRPWLPPVRVIAEFSSGPLDEKSWSSSAVVIWYQQEDFPFLGQDVVDDFAMIDWAKSAKNAAEPWMQGGGEPDDAP